MLGISCKPLYNKEYTKPILTDSKPSRPVKKLHRQLYYSGKAGIAIGHQDDMAYGIDWFHRDAPDSVQSDVKLLTGSLPAVFGFDIAGIENDDSLNIDNIPFTTMRELMIHAYKSGGIVTVSWHADNPVSGGDSWDVKPAVSSLLRDSSTKAKVELWHSRVATFLKTVKYKGKPIPIVFRPWHEMNGHWFWWGDPNASNEDYKELWKETVRQLRDKHGLNNLLYAYSPNTLDSKIDYLKYYPGDEYVDILGIDVYDFDNRDGYVESVKANLEIVREVAQEKDKLYAFTETGLERIGKENWFNNLYSGIEDTGITWILFWRNATRKHHYVPFKGHSAEADFKKFSEQPKTLLLKDLQELKN